MSIKRFKAVAEQQDDKQSAVISCDLTLFIRLLEIAREELKTDADLHQLVERCSEQMASKGKPLTMDDYEAIKPAEG
jgi:hypothetical protein